MNEHRADPMRNGGRSSLKPDPVEAVIFEYCRSHGIPHSTFYRALSRLRQRACEPPAKPVTNEQRQAVAPVSISELPLDEVERILKIRRKVCILNPFTLRTIDFYGM